MKKINGISITRLNNGAHDNFIYTILKRAFADKTVMTKTAREVENLKSAFDEEERMFGVSRKSLLTDEIAAANKERTAIYIGYKRAVKGFLNVPDEEMADAAKVLFQQIKDHRISPYDQMHKKTGALMILLEDLEDKYSAQVAKLSLGPFVTTMKAANERMKALYVQRSDERTCITVHGLKKARFATDAAYRALVDMVNALNLVSGNDEFSDFIDYVNTEIVQYKRLALGRRSSATADEDNEDKEEDAPADTPAEEDTPTPDDDYGA